MKRIHLSFLILLALCSTVFAQSANETILNLMQDIFTQVPKDLTEIDPELQRIAIYRINVDETIVAPALRTHFQNRLLEIFRTLDRPAMVSLPDLNTLKISSSDSSFSIRNALPSPDELWRVGRRLRVDAFVEGNLTYVRGKAMYLDLRLNRTGTNEVLWARSYSAYEKNFNVQTSNPMRRTFHAGLEIFPIEFDAPGDSLLHGDFNNRLVQYSAYFGIYQYLSASSRVRYELRAGVSFLSDGVRLNNTEFAKSAFYAQHQLGQFLPVSYNFRALLHTTMIQDKENRYGDWLAFYLSVTRYFTLNMPDLTGIGVGLRSDLSSRFSVSAGMSMILGPEFDSQIVESTGESLRAQINGVHFDFMLLQVSF
jgi:hypothetical protein